MNCEPVWLDFKIVRAIHHDQITEHGGHLGIRSRELIESALARPKQRWSLDPDSDLPALAAAYGFGIAKNHGFIDGNKRTALMTMYTFLALNNLALVAPEPEVVEIMVEIACGERPVDELAAWVRHWSRPIRSE